MRQVQGASAIILALAACGPTRISTLVTPSPEPTVTQMQPTASATFTPYPTYTPPTDTPMPSPSFTPDPNDSATSPIIQRLEDTKANLQNRQIPWLISDLIQDTREPSSSTSPLVLSATLRDGALMWDNWWCAASNGMLAGNLAVMDFSYAINSEAVDSGLGVTFSQHLRNGSVCSVKVFYLTDWPQGDHELEYTFTVNGNTNDGYRVYGPGTYRKIYIITVP